MHLNRIEIIGNVGQDPNIKNRQSDGKPIVTFSVATPKRYKTADGEQRKDTQWHKVTAFPGTSEYVIACHTKKGSCVFCAGEMHYDSYMNQQTGQTQYYATIHLREFQMLSKPAKSAENGTPETGNAQDQEQEEDLPF